MTASLAFLAAAFFGAATAFANCPFCPPSSPTLAERVAESDVSALVEWSSVEVSEDGENAVTSLKVLDVLRQAGNTVTAGSMVSLPFLREGNAGEWLVLMGKFDSGAPEVEPKHDAQSAKGPVVLWAEPVEVNEVSYGYIKRTPSPEQPAAKRLEYYLAYLEHPDQTIANDAFAEFSRARYQDVTALRASLPRDRLRKWVAAPTTSPIRLGFYGLLLGLAGEVRDQEFLRELAFSKPSATEVRLGIDGLMAGYLLLAGPDGFDELSRAKLDEAYLPTSELFAFLNTIRFFHEYGSETIPNSQLETAAARLLDSPELGEVVVIDLARWKAWQLADNILRRFGTVGFESPAAKQKLVQFAEVCLKDARKAGAENPPPTGPAADRLQAGAVAAEKFLEMVRSTEPALLQPPKGIGVVRPSRLP